MYAVRVIAVVIGLSGSLAGCDPCLNKVSGPCLPPIQLTVRDAQSGEVVPSAMLTGAAATCSEGVCTVNPPTNGSSPVGSYDLSVSADGYAQKSLTVVVRELEEEGCFGCGFENVVTDVLLEP